MEEISIGQGARDRLGMPDMGIDDDNEFDSMEDGTVDGFARNVHTRTNGRIRAIRSRFLITGMIREMWRTVNTIMMGRSMPMRR